MDKYVAIFLFFFCVTGWSQTDFSASWEDFYSYNNVKDFVKADTKIYAIVDNAVFIYDTSTQEIDKLSSVHGLSGKTTSSIYFSQSFQRLVIGYDTGLIEVVGADGNITISNDIERLSITGEKSINDIVEYNNKLYLATPFAVVVYDIDKLQFGDTYFIGNGSSEVYINQLEVFEDTIYAATEIGIFVADATSNNLIDFNNWQQPQGNFTGDFKAMEVFNNQLYTTKNNEFYRVNTSTTLQLINSLADTILNLKASEENITVTTKNSAYVYNTNLVQLVVASAIQEYEFTLQSAYAENFTIYLGTKEFGILQRSFSDAQTHTEIHPQGPISNDVFSITVGNDNFRVVYGP